MATMLMVDSDATARHTTQYMLQAAGHTVITMRHPHEAITQLIRTPCNLLITELLAPQFNGFALLHSLRAHQHYRGLPVLVLTTSASARDRQRALSMGATGYLTRPVSSEMLVATVQRLLQQRIRSLVQLPQHGNAFKEEGNPWRGLPTRASSGIYTP